MKFKYRVPIRFVYTEFVEVEGENPRDAWEQVMEMDKEDILDDTKDSISVDELDWDYNWLDSMDDSCIDVVVEEVEE